MSKFDSEDLATWLNDVRTMKENGHLVAEHDIDSVIALLEQARSEHRAVTDVIDLRNELMATPDGPAAPVAKAFGLEIDRALKGQRHAR